tara:strand:+ start:202 stop:1218 length:1017 start_codon:yes stop_codon:yes gene_type:complete
MGRSKATKAKVNAALRRAGLDVEIWYDPGIQWVFDGPDTYAWGETGSGIFRLDMLTVKEWVDYARERMEDPRWNPTPKGGQCFPWAYEYINENPDAMLLHGYVTEPLSDPPKRYWHGWVIHNGIVKDYQTMVEGHGGRFAFKGYPVALWMSLYKPWDVEEYERDEARAARAYCRHVGPWHGPHAEGRTGSGRMGREWDREGTVWEYRNPEQFDLDFSTRRPPPKPRPRKPRTRLAAAGRRSIKVTERQGDYIMEALLAAGHGDKGAIQRPSVRRLNLTKEEAAAAYNVLGEMEDVWPYEVASTAETEAQSDFAEAQTLKCMLAAEAKLTKAFGDTLGG